MTTPVRLRVARLLTLATSAGMSVVFAMALPPAALGKTYLYPATCQGSYSKQGEQTDDLTKQAGKPIKCDALVFSAFDNGHYQVQVVEKTARLTPLGFAGSKLDYDMNPNFATLPLERIYLPHVSNPGVPQTVSGVEGFCFLDGKLNIRALSGVSCAAKIEIGTQRLVYHIDAHITGLGEAVPER